jgi:hypothetical protein
MGGLSPATCAEIDRLLGEVDLAREYRAYRWKMDSWIAGFPNICTIELSLISAARKNRLGYFQVPTGADWGGHPNPLSIRCREPFDLPLWAGADPAPHLVERAEEVMGILEREVRGLGPVLCSTMLRFAVPSAFGSIDPVVVRLFGAGDHLDRQCRLLDLYAARSGRGCGYRRGRTPGLRRTGPGRRRSTGLLASSMVKGSPAPTPGP